ncbi:phenol degradation protein meta [Pandoraea aquatica]|uniref:Phenol degradation protein meta n=2 Tax=Pandoraea aquatica TaxID=2508290 RepID=A0A5E4RFE5_9BURK|nr:transporter [Pandoraea aquatica]VVD62040.1 phenol degradation protein meta [Pandoraea aquatica]
MTLDANNMLPSRLLPASSTKNTSAVRDRRCRKPLAFAATLFALAATTPHANATEGALGRPVSGTGVQPNAGVVSPEPIWAVNIAEIYFDGNIGGSRQAPIAGTTSLGLNGELSFTLATLMKTWKTDTGAWNFASSFTLPYLWTKTTATLSGGRGNSLGTSQTASNLFDITFTPIIAGYHFSQTDHMSFSVAIWAPTGRYDPNALANPSLNNWTFIPQVAYTKFMPSYGLEFDVIAGVQFYTRNTATNYQNAPLFTLDVMGLKKFSNGLGVGLVMGTTQQLGSDSGPTADQLNGFRGHDFALGPIVTYDTKIDGKHPLSFSARWVPTITATNRLKSTKTFMATATLIF